MKKALLLTAVTGVVLFGGFGKSAFGQTYFRELGTPTYYEPVSPPTPEQEDRYNMALGPVRFSIAAGLGIEFNDNINLSDDHRESDIILRPSVSLDSTWRISELNTLRFTLGLGYAKYLSHSENDTHGIIISPSSELAFTVWVGDVRLTLRDRFSYQEDPFDVPTLSGVATYRRWENAASVQADWDLNEKITLTGGYEHYNLWVVDDVYREAERSVDTIFFKPSYKITPTILTGFNTSVSWVDYKEDIQNDGTSWMFGPFVDFTLSEATRVYLEAGYQMFSFGSGGSDLDNSDSNSWYVRSEITNKATETYTQRLALSRTAEAGFGSNYYTLYHAEYGGVWHPRENLSVLPSAFIEYYETSGEPAEEATRWGAAIGTRWAFTPSVTMGLDYRFLMKDSNVEHADYRQNLVLLSIFYNF